jgi:hypothetical protein
MNTSLPFWGWSCKCLACNGCVPSSLRYYIIVVTSAVSCLGGHTCSSPQQLAGGRRPHHSALSGACFSCLLSHVFHKNMFAEILKWNFILYRYLWWFLTLKSYFCWQIISFLKQGICKRILIFQFFFSTKSPKLTTKK